MADSLFEQQLKSARQMLERDILAGSSAVVEGVLKLHPAIATDESAVVDLIYSEHLIREEQGESPSVEEYLQRFPEHEERITRLFRIHSTLETGKTMTDEKSSPLLTENFNLRQRQFAAGDLIGSFELIARLGQGGKGIVYKARQVELDRIVALKILRNNISDVDDIRSLLDEAKASARLHHPHIVQIFEIDFAEGCPYISFEYVAGGTLEEKSSGNPLPAVETAEMIADLAGAMHYAHCQGVIHRDLKPSNIMLTEECVPKVTDFGLAKRTSYGSDKSAAVPQANTETGIIIGTPSYMAPEQAAGRNRDVGPRTDVYGLGAVLYQLLTGQAPFVGESALDTLRNILSLDPVAPTQHNPKVPRDLETICLKCLEKDRNRRYGTAADLESDLRHFLAGRAIVARPSSLFHRAYKLAKRHPGVSAMAFGLLVTVSAAFSIVAWQWKEAELGQRTEASLRNEAEGLLYTQQIALAQREIGASECQRASEILKNTDPTKRHWEWDFFSRCCESHRLLASLGPDTRRCVVSPDGKLLAVVKGRWGSDLPGLLAVINVDTGKLLHEQTVDFGPIMDVAFTPDGKSIATGSMQFGTGKGRVAIWDSDSGKQIETISEVSSGVFGVAYHPSKPLLALACTNLAVEIWNVEFQKRIHTLKGHRGNCFKVAFSPDGDQLASCSRDGTVRLWDVASGKLTDVLYAPTDVRNIAYTPDGRYVVINGYDRAIQFWDLMESPPRKTKIHLAGDSPASYGFSISPKGRYVVAFGEKGKRVFSYDMSNGELSARSAEMSKPTFWLAHHPLDQRLFLVDADGRVFESRLQRKKIHRPSVIPQPKDFVFSWDGKDIAFAPGLSRAFPWRRDYRFRSLPLEGDKSKLQFYQGADTWGSSVAFSQDGKQLFGGCDNGEILCWNIASRELLRKFVGHEGPVLSLMDHPSDGELVSVGSDGWLRKWDLSLGKATEEMRVCNGALAELAVSRSGVHLAVASEDGWAEVFAWKMGSSTEKKSAALRSVARLRVQEGNIKSLAISDDGEQLAVATQNIVELWALGNSVPISPIWSAVMQSSGVTQLSFHPDGRRLAVIDSWLGRASVVDTENGFVAVEFDTRSGAPTADIKFSRDGRTLLAALAGELFIWDASSSGVIKGTSQPDQQPNAMIAVRSKSEIISDFKWHVSQALEQSYGKHFFGAEYHARNAIELSDEHDEVLKSRPLYESDMVHVRCHLAKSLIELGRGYEGTELLEMLLKETVSGSSDDHESMQTLSLLLATYPGKATIDPTHVAELAKKTLLLHPKNSNAWATAGIAHYRIGEKTAARRFLETAEKLMSTRQGLVWFPLVVLDAEEGHLDEAMARFKQAEVWMNALPRKNPIIRELRARALAKLNEKGL